MRFIFYDPGVFLDHVKDMGFDRVASGHYAKVTRAGGETVLQLSSDEVGCCFMHYRFFVLNN